MQSPSLIFALFMLGAIPLLMILSNHEVYFIVMGILLLAASIKNIYKLSVIKNVNPKYLYDEAELSELEGDGILDVRKISTGTKMAKSLIIIVFIFYCTLYTSHFIFKIIGASLCLYHINYIIDCMKFYRINKNIKLNALRKTVFLSVNASTIILIVMVAINKYAS